MAQIKTEELEGAALDWAVAKCEGNIQKFSAHNDNGQLWIGDGSSGIKIRYSPVTDWAEGGPILEQNHIMVEWWNEEHEWRASISDDFEQYGNTYLEAAMRCYIASVLGDVVLVPDELVKAASSSDSCLVGCSNNKQGKA